MGVGPFGAFTVEFTQFLLFSFLALGSMILAGTGFRTSLEAHIEAADVLDRPDLRRCFGQRSRQRAHRPH